jgi:hypothetical protein
MLGEKRLFRGKVMTIQSNVIQAENIAMRTVDEGAGRILGIRVGGV